MSFMKNDDDGSLKALPLICLLAIVIFLAALIGNYHNPYPNGPSPPSGIPDGFVPAPGTPVGPGTTGR